MDDDDLYIQDQLATPGQGSRSCTCKKSRCIKLYCDCFASGRVCDVDECRCIACLNNGKNLDAVKEAKKSILEKNPDAFNKVRNRRKITHMFGVFHS